MRGKCCSSGQRSSGGWQLTAWRVSPIRQTSVLTPDLPDGEVWVARFGDGYRHPSSCPGASRADPHGMARSPLGASGRYVLLCYFAERATVFRGLVFVVLIANINDTSVYGIAQLVSDRIELILGDEHADINDMRARSRTMLAFILNLPFPRDRFVPCFFFTRRSPPRLGRSQSCSTTQCVMGWSMSTPVHHSTRHDAVRGQ